MRGDERVQDGMFSYVSLLFGGILIYTNVFFYNLSYFEEQVGAGIGVIFLAAGITRLWMKRRFKQD
jgi:Zn-dependent M28 family amino/carboxypeptidase